MKKSVVALVMVLVICFTLTGCGETEDAGKKPKDSDVNSGEKALKANLEETVVVDKNDIKITVKSIDYDSLFGPEIKVLIENNSSQNITVQSRNFSINGIMVDPMFSVDVAAGKKANDGITLPSSSLKTAKIDTIKDIEFDINVSDSSTWDDIFKETGIKLQTDAKDYNQVYNTDGTLVVDQNDIKIYALKLDDKDSFWGADIYLYIENNSDKDVTVQVRDVSINGFMVDPVFSSDVVSGKKAYDSITFFESDLKKNDIKDISELELKFNVSNAKNWDTIFKTNNMKITF